jgi:hypothetical protein
MASGRSYRGRAYWTGATRTAITCVSDPRKLATCRPRGFRAGYNSQELGRDRERNGLLLGDW